MERALNTTLFLVKVPREANPSAGSGPGKNEKELIGIAEQMISSFSNLHSKGWNKFRYGEPYVVLEIAVHHVGEETLFYLSVPKSNEDIIEKQLYGFYPQAEISKVLDYNIFNSQGATSGAYLTYSAHPILPFKTYQKLEADYVKFNMSSENVNQLARETVNSFKLLAEQKGLRVILNLAAELPNISCDKDKVIQVMMNLISNAVKFTPRGEIKIKTERGNNWVLFSVEDEGPGIKSEDQGKLFQSFSQIPHEGHKQPGGSGLGLAISKKIIEKHGGRIGVDSVDEKGSTFYFVLPITERRNI